IKIWCYEDVSQKIDIFKSDALPLRVSRIITTILCVKVNRGLLQLPLTDDLPDMESLATMFAGWRSPICSSFYQQLRITDMNQSKKLPDEYEAGFTHTPTRNLIMGPRFHIGVPDICPSGEMRFLTNPLITSLIQPLQFAQTMDAFLDLKAYSTTNVLSKNALPQPFLSADATIE
ncbi:hypothetical protein IE077_003088, partial [Cardiosporidium cionae]